jgi:hypothetical protein
MKNSHVIFSYTERFKSVLYHQDRCKIETRLDQIFFPRVKKSFLVEPKGEKAPSDIIFENLQPNFIIFNNANSEISNNHSWLYIQIQILLSAQELL